MGYFCADAFLARLPGLLRSQGRVKPPRSPGTRCTGLRYEGRSTFT